MCLDPSVLVRLNHRGRLQPGLTAHAVGIVFGAIILLPANPTAIEIVGTDQHSRL